MPISILFTETGLIAALQTIGPWLVPILIAFTSLGTEEFYLLVVPFTYWCLDSGLGIRLGTMLMFSQASNQLLKLAFHSPRPYWIDPKVQAYSSETSFGLPSGHAQISSSMWGLAATYLRRRWVTILFAGILFLIGFSRIYLGVHFISDVLVGWLIGGLLVWVFLRWEKSFLTRFIRFSFWRQLALIVLGAAFFLGVRGLIQECLVSWQMPGEWSANALAATDSAIDPTEIKGIFSLVGIWIGLLGGLAWYYRGWGKFNPSGKVWHLALRYLIGLAGVLILWAGLGKVFPGSDDSLGLTLRALRYGLVGLWVSALAPLIFIKIGLAKANS
jgi:membrane-associated phospholipid phosphatase